MIIDVLVWILTLAAYAFVALFAAGVVLWTTVGICCAIGAWRRHRTADRDAWIDIVEAARGRRGDTCPDCQFWDPAGDRPAYLPCVIHDETYWQQLGSEVTS